MIKKSDGIGIYFKGPKTDDDDTKKSDHLDDYEFVDSYGQVCERQLGKEHDLTPGTYIIAVETQVMNVPNEDGKEQDNFGKPLNSNF